MIPNDINDNRLFHIVSTSYAVGTARPFPRQLSGRVLMGGFCRFHFNYSERRNG